MSRRSLIGSVVLLATVLGSAGGLAAWKSSALEEADRAATMQPEPAEAILVATAEARSHRKTTTAIGTVLAMRSITLRNELPGTVNAVMLTPGEVVDKGTILVTLDVSVEEAELKAQEAQAVLAQTLLDRMQRASENRAASELDVERARAERDVALAQIARTQAVIARKTIRAPFRARVGMADLHVGQYLHQGTDLTTLQGVDDAVHVDFRVAQPVASSLEPGQKVEVFTGGGAPQAIQAEIVAIDARVDPSTRNATVRVRLEAAETAPAPGASVRVRVPVGPPLPAVAIPVTALRRGPSGDHVFVVEPDAAGNLRAHVRRVEARATMADEVVIHGGLEPGEQVAASGSFKLREGVLVFPQDPAAPAAAQGH